MGNPAKRETLYHDDPTSEVPEGYTRFVRTYDNGLPITWADVPDGTEPPEELFLCTEAARLYMMDDDEFDRYEAYLERDPYKPQLDDTETLVRRSISIAFLISGLIFMAMAVTILLTSGTMVPLMFVLSAMLLLVPMTSSVRRRLARKPTPRPPSEEKGLQRRLKRFADTPRTEALAEATFRQLNAIRDLRESTQSAIDANFPPGSLTNAKFSSVLSGACDAMHENTEGIVTKLEITSPMLDEDLRTPICLSHQSRKERRHSYDMLATDVTETLGRNESIMADIKSLRQELLSLYTNGSTDRLDHASNRVKELTAQTRMYAHTPTS